MRGLEALHGGGGMCGLGGWIGALTGLEQGQGQGQNGASVGQVRMRIGRWQMPIADGRWRIQRCDNGKPADMKYSECITDNPTRTVSKVKEILHKYGYVRVNHLYLILNDSYIGLPVIVLKVITEHQNRCRISPVSFLFDKKGIITIHPSSCAPSATFEALFEVAVENGADDVRESVGVSDEDQSEDVWGEREGDEGNELVNVVWEVRLGSMNTTERVKDYLSEIHD